MDREQLHHAGLWRLGPRHELVGLFRVIEPRQEARDRAAVIRQQERPHLVEERPQARGRDARRPARLVGRELDVEPQFELDHADEIGDRLADGPTQPLEELAGLTQARATVGGDVGEEPVARRASGGRTRGRR